MAWIIETPNPFRPLDGLKKHRHAGGITIWEWLRETYPGFTEFNTPTLCVVNGKPRMRKQWDEPIQEDDVVNFIACTGIEYVIVAIVLIVVSVILALVTQPSTPGEQPESDPVFTIKGQVNQVRMGEPIECNYGRNRIYPSLASRPFYRYQHNDQYQHSLFCIGQGVYEIEEVQIGDTSIDQFDEAEYEILEPGDVTTLFDTNVVTSIEVGGQTLYAPNEPEYPVDGWIGPFDVSPPTTEVQQIEIDILFPKGLYHTSKKGQTQSNTIVYQVQTRLIDDAGAPLGAFTLLEQESFTAATMTPRRITHRYAVTVGRYEIRIRRVDGKNFGGRDGHDAVWDGLRGFVTGEQPDYGDVTMLAVKIRATNNLNARTREKFNVIATRKLPIRFEGSSGSSDSEGWSEPIATRSIVWAFVDVMRSHYGGQITDDSYYDWDTLWALEALYESRNEHFDWTFRDPVTVWEAARTIARVGRGVPLLVGSLISLKRDAPAIVPIGMFIPDNIIQGTFTWDIKLWDLNEHDSIQIEYTDPTTGYKQETVHCILPDDSDAGSNSKDMRLPGIQDRQHAYREGMYILAVERYLRENVTFETGMEGIIPSYGDLIAVVHDVPQWGQSGYILDAQELTDGTWLLCVSEPLIFSDASDGANQIMLRNNRAELIGPLNVEETSDPKQVIIHLAGEATDFSFLLGGGNEPMLFMFGQTGDITQYLKVVKVEPQGGERIKITAVPEVPAIFSFDELVAPELDKPTGPPEVPDNPEISHLTLTQVDSTLMLVQAVWSASFGATSYIVQISRDADNWEFLSQTPRTSVQFQGWPGPVYVRVAALNEGQGPWIESSITLTLTLGLENHIPWECLQWGIRWWEDINIDAYLIRVYDNSNESGPILKRTTQQTELEFIYTYEMALEDGNLVSEMLVTVDTMNLDEDTGDIVANELPRPIELSNAAPALPTEDSSGASPGVELFDVSSDGLTYTWRLFWDNPDECDLHCFAIWLSLTESFDPVFETPYTEECVSNPGSSPDMPTETYVTTELDSDLTHPDYFWWVALRDAWSSMGAASGPHLLAPAWILEFNEWDDFGRWEDDNFWRD